MLLPLPALAPSVPEVSSAGTRGVVWVLAEGWDAGCGILAAVRDRTASDVLPLQLQVMAAPPCSTPLRV